MRILITGAGGLLGSTFVRLIPGIGHDVWGLHRDELDVTDEASVHGAVRAHRPELILNCAAQAGVDHAEEDPAGALAVNRDGPRYLAEAALEAGARFVHFSTDYVFDGTSQVPYQPHEPVGPLGMYAASKAAGEDAVLEVSARHIVVRTSWLFGGGPRDFVSHVLARARAGEPLRLVEDQWSRPTWAENVVPTVLELLDHDVTGIWHVCDDGEASREEEARVVLEVAHLHTDIELVTRAQMWPDVPRPAYTVLDISATEEVVGRAMMPWPESVQRMLVWS